MQLSLSAAENRPLQSKQPVQPKTIVIACAEASACESTWKSLLRERAVVLRNQGGQVSAATRAALSELIGARPIERVMVLGHVGCVAHGAAEPMQNTAALTAWHRLAPAVRRLTRERAVGLPTEDFVARLDTLVQLANLEGCATLHAALRRGDVSAHAAVCDARSGTFALFDGVRFNPIDAVRFADLIAEENDGAEHALDEQEQSSVRPLPTMSPVRPADCGLPGPC